MCTHVYLASGFKPEFDTGCLELNPAESTELSLRGYEGIFCHG